MKRTILTAILIELGTLISLTGCAGGDSPKTGAAIETPVLDTSSSSYGTVGSAPDSIAVPNSEQPSEEQSNSPASVQASKASQSALSEGKALMSQSDCLSCHKTDSKLVGPAFLDVAGKYPDSPDNLTRLADKIIKGGAGVWGEIPMPPHPALSQADANKMAQYILSLK